MADRQTDRHTDRQTHRQTDIHTNKPVCSESGFFGQAQTRNKVQNMKVNKIWYNVGQVRETFVFIIVITHLSNKHTYVMNISRCGYITRHQILSLLT